MLLSDMWSYIKGNKIKLQTSNGVSIEAYDTHKFMNAKVEHLAPIDGVIVVTINM